MKADLLGRLRPEEVYVPYQHDGPPEKAEAAYRRALELLEPLAREHPQEYHYLDSVTAGRVTASGPLRALRAHRSPA